MHVKKDDNVIVIAGSDKGKTGTVVKAMPRDNKVVIAGINMKKRHRKPRKNGEKGQVVEFPHPIDVSKVKLVSGEVKTAKVKVAPKAKTSKTKAK